MKLLLLIFLGTVLFSCTPQKSDINRLFADHSPVPMYQEVEVTVSLHPEHVDDYERICDQLEEMAWNEGISQLLHAYVDQAGLLRPVQGAEGAGGALMSALVATPNPALSAASSATDFRRLMACDPWLDNVTGLISQSVHYTSALTPVQRLAGVIDSLQDNQTMGGMLSRAYVSLLGPPLGDAPIPVLIVQQSFGLEQGLMQIVGSGLITQHSETVGQMRILESTREIFPEDLFFQLQVRAEVLPMVGDFVPLGPGNPE